MTTVGLGPRVWFGNWIGFGAGIRKESFGDTEELGWGCGGISFWDPGDVSWQLAPGAWVRITNVLAGVRLGS